MKSTTREALALVVGFPLALVMAVVSAHAYTRLWEYAALPVDWNPGVAEMIAASAIFHMFSYLPHQPEDETGKSATNRLVTLLLAPWLTVLLVNVVWWVT